MNVKMPVGVEDFKKLREGGYYFVDKTAFIKELLDTHGDVTLITRPRRFGKTLTMSMLDYFFSAEKKEISRGLFDGMAIAAEGTRYMEEQGRYPVIYLSLKDVKQPSWPEMLNFLKKVIGNYFIDHDYLLQGAGSNPRFKEQFTAVMDRTEDQGDLELSLRLLMKMMQDYYGRPVILLLDEYDAPVQAAWSRGFYDECISFMRTFLGSALKSNPYLEFAVLTGVLRIAKESIFSGLNNLRVSTVLDDGYSTAMGFTPEEVARMAADLSMEDHLPELAAWYDGYHFGNADIYNPWSIVNYFNEKRLDDYWVNTSANDILAALLDQNREDPVLLDLLAGETVTASIREGVIYDDIGQDRDVLYSMLLTTGYLTAVHKEKNFGGWLCLLAIPNREVQDVFRHEVVERTRHTIPFSQVVIMMKDLVEGRAEAFTKAFRQYLAAQVSFYDTAQKESFYHGLLLGLTGLLVPDYQVESNGESGYGRFDLAIFPKDVRKQGVLLECKAAKAEEELDGKAEEALRQIREKHYAAGFEKRGIHEVWLYGIAFYKKQVRVVHHIARN